MGAKKKISEAALKKALAEKNYSGVKSVKHEGDNKVQVEAHKLHPVHHGKTKEPLYVPVPVSLSVSLDGDNKVRHIEEQASPDAVTNANTYVNTLVQNNEIEGVGDEAKQNATHKIEVNEQGQQVLTRRGFSAY